MIVYLDTNCVIYFVERNGTWWPRIVGRISRLRSAGDELAVSDLTRAECLVGPYRNADRVLEASYQAFFSDPDVKVLSLTAGACERAARIRATHRFDLPDALHLATAREHGCGVFLTNEARLVRCGDMAVELLV